MKAKYPRELRFQWYAWVKKHKHSVKETCQLFGIQRKIYYYWHNRDYGLIKKNYVSRKLHSNLKLTTDLKIFIEKQKLITNYGPLKMSILVKKKLGINVSPTTIYEYYKKKKLIRKPQKKLPWYQPMKERLIINKQGEGVQVDVKYIYNEQGIRRYQFSVLDVFTEKYYFQIFPTKESRNSIVVHKNAEKYFGFKIVSVQSDNGSENRGNYHNWLTRKNITHYFIPKSSPNWNPHVERIHKTIDDEFYQNPYRVWNTPYEWLQFYNFERIHLTLNGLTPQEKLESVTIGC